jgi:hypothetical protein
MRDTRGKPFISERGEKCPCKMVVNPAKMVNIAAPDEKGEGHKRKLVLQTWSSRF